jgi:hypothetical protein
MKTSLITTGLLAASLAGVFLWMNRMEPVPAESLVINAAVAGLPGPAIAADISVRKGPGESASAMMDPMSMEARTRFGELLQNDPAAALAEVDAYADEGTRRFWIRRGVMDWAERDFPKVWSRMLTWREPERAEWLVLLLTHRSGSDPADAVARLAEAGLAGKDRFEALKVISARVSQNDPEEALRWVLELPAAEQGSAAFNLIAEVARIHPALAERWTLENVEDSPRRESLLAYIGTLKR